jgi:hypothetical protein
MKVRTWRRFVDRPSRFPAMSFGDAGSAVGVCVAARALAEGYAPGVKGAVVLRAGR